MTSGVSRSRGGHARYLLQCVRVVVLSLLWITTTNAADSDKAWQVTDAVPLADALLEQVDFHGGVIAHQPGGFSGGSSSDLRSAAQQHRHGLRGSGTAAWQLPLQPGG